jgi:hypothetical protein
MTETADVLDLAIVGMGPAGLYAAWRLATTASEQITPLWQRPVKKLRIGIFDTMGEDGVGGRLCTQPLPGYPFLAELGGMRFRSNQLLINGLVDALNLRDSVRPFEFDQRFYFLREERLHNSHFSSSASLKVPYRLTRDEEGKLPHELIELAIHKTLASLHFGMAFTHSPQVQMWGIDRDELINKLQSPEGIRELTPREWAIIQRCGEYRHANYLFDVGFWDLLQFQLSPGAWHLAHDGLGYESIMGNWNAAIALPWFLTDFTSARTETLEDGMSAIPRRMYERIKQTANFRIHHGFDLVAIDTEKPDPQSEQLVRLRFDVDGARAQTVRARAVILALPKGALIRMDYGRRIIEQISVPQEDLVKRAWYFDLLHSVDGRALFKLFLGYREPWWTNSQAWADESGNRQPVHGKSNTDLPLRQVYYFGPERWHKDRQTRLGLTEQDYHSMIMASYTDSHYIEFWTELARQDADQVVPLRLLDEDHRSVKKYGAPRTMIARAEHQLGLLHGIKIPKSAEAGLYMEWSRPPYYAGWHSWKVGAKPWEVMTRLLCPFSPTNVFICGEAYSTEQGWTEGALKSTERLLSQYFKLPLPPAIETRLSEAGASLLEYVGAVDGSPL